MNQALTLFAIMAGLAACGIVLSFYMLARSEWVYKRRSELIERHFSDRHLRTCSFDGTWGTYDAWLYRRPFCWNAAKLAGLPEWVA